MIIDDDSEVSSGFCGSALETAYRDHAARTALHARHCVTLAAVAPTSIAGELIDQAIALRAALRKGLALQSVQFKSDDCRAVDASSGKYTTADNQADEDHDAELSSRAA